MSSEQQAHKKKRRKPKKNREIDSNGDANVDSNQREQQHHEQDEQHEHRQQQRPRQHASSQPRPYSNGQPGDPSNSNSNSNNPTGLNLPPSNNLPPSSNQSLQSSSTAATLTELQTLCDVANSLDPSSWEAIRAWLRRHSAHDARQAAQHRGDYDTTPLHLACRNCPPLDIVGMLVTASPNTVTWADSFGWLPLHYACANEASEEVLVLLAEEYPESKTCEDRRKRTPLHFALGHTERPAGVDTVRLLSGTGAALFPDENGMLPLHYACAYGATEEALRVLTDNHIETITATDTRGRTPLHFALGNADRPASPGVVNLLLSQNPAVVNSIDAEGNLPIHLLATRAQAIKDYEKDKCTNCQECLSFYLDANPQPTADLLTALQALPEWLRDLAVLSPVVQKMLNLKISQRFPTFFTLMDLFMYVIVIYFFHLAVESSLKERYTPDPDAPPPMEIGYLVPLYLAVSYFTMRECVQAVSLASLGLFDTWFTDLTNWFDLFYIFLILFWAIGMQTKGFDDEFFRTGCAITLGVFWMNILLFLKSMMVGFAVFVGGVVYVVKRLLAFLITLIIILLAFAQMFYTVFRQDDNACPALNETSSQIEKCNNESYVGQNYNYTQTYSYTNEPINVETCDMDDEENCVCSKLESCEPTNDNPWCNFWTSLYRCYTMLLGEVNEQDFFDSEIATVFFAAFMFGVVILLANVLIAIVTDSYSVIKNERAAVVFWSNRLDFVAEMDVISNSFLRFRRKEDTVATFDEEDTFGRELWKKFMYLFEEEVANEDHGVISLEFVIYSLLRLFTAIFIIPVWIGLGAVTFGMLWPPQVREQLLTGRLTRRSTTEVTNRMNQVLTLRQDLASFHTEIIMDMDRGRDEIEDIKIHLQGAKTEINIEMNKVKETVTELFEVVSLLRR